MLIKRRNVLGSLGGMAMDAWPRHGLQAVLSAAAFLLFAGLLSGALRRR